jgi:diguanylate cyclase (GGDEF)-like protein
MHKENIFLKIVTYGPLLFVPFVVGVILLVFIQTYNESFNLNLQKIEQNLYNIEKKSVENKVTDVANLISYKKSIIEEELKYRIKTKVESALLQAENIYQKNKNSKSEIELKEIIRNALRPLVWNKGESFIWIVDYNGIFNLAPKYLKHLEGSSIINLKDAMGREIIKEEIEIVKSKKKSGFISDTFTKPNDPKNKQFEQIAYVKSFGHYNWYFGSGEYIDTATKKTNKKLIEAIEQIDNINSDENYIFLFNSKGDVLINKAAPNIIRKNITQIDNQLISSGIKKILSTIKNNDISFITYEWINLNSNKIEIKHSYVRKIPNTDWVIGSGFYISDIQSKLSQETLDMTKMFTKKSKNILYLAIVIMILSLFVSYYISRKLKQSFGKYEKNINTKNNELNEFNNTLEDKVQKRTNELQQLKDDFEKLATIDTLTQINNRYSLMNILSAEVNRAHRYNTPLSLIIYDIDFFKKVNDNYGHQVGDSVLISLSKIVKNNLREIDTIGRYGGEEFLLVLPNTNINDAKVLANRIREEVEKYSFKIVGTVTISLGLVEYQEKEKIDELFKRVDKLLYKSKNNGRNQVSF